MRRLTFLALAAALSLSGQPVFDQSRVDQLVTEALSAWRVPGVAVAIVRNGEVVYLKGHGVRQLGQPEPVTPDSLFQIASTTKAFTTAALALLVEEGKLNWDDPVRKHLEYFRLADPLANENLTIRDLVTHRTGMPRHDSFWYKTSLSREEVIRRLGEAKASKQFREEYQYQNIQFLAAGELIGKVTGSTWDDFVRRRLFEPLGMKGTTTRYAEAMARTDRAMPHRRLADNDNASIDWVNFDNVGGAGCINSSARDLAQWVRLHLGGGEVDGRRIVATKHLAETYAPHMVIRPEARARELAPASTQRTYAMGWFIDHYRGQTLLTHSGALDGFRAMVTLAPEHKLGIVVLANLGPTTLPQALSNTLVDHLTGLSPRAWNTELLAVLKRHAEEDAVKKKARTAKRAVRSRPTLLLDRYAGSYRAPGYGLLRVTESGGTLAAECLTLRTSLEHYQYDTFSVPEGSPRQPHPFGGEELVFHLDADGQVARVEFLNTEFRRVP